MELPGICQSFFCLFFPCDHWKMDYWSKKEIPKNLGQSFVLECTGAL